MTARKIVAVPYFYPPFPGAGIRWASMARHLRHQGHSVRVVATAAFGSLDDDLESGVLRVGDLRTSPVLRRLLRRDELPVAGSVAHEPPESPLLTKVLVPDAQVLSWMPAALSCIRRLAASGEIDCLVTSSPPESTHLIGLLLGRHRPPWIAELRDGWLFEPLRKPFPTAPQRALDASLERRVFTTADVVVGATLPIAEDVQSRFDAPARWVSNGWDPEDPAANASTAPAPVTGEGIRLVHTGTLVGRDADLFFARSPSSGPMDTICGSYSPACWGAGPGRHCARGRPERRRLSRARDAGRCPGSAACSSSAAAHHPLRPLGTPRASSSNTSAPGGQSSRLRGEMKPSGSFERRTPASPSPPTTSTRSPQRSEASRRASSAPRTGRSAWSSTRIRGRPRRWRKRLRRQSCGAPLNGNRRARPRARSPAPARARAG